jgi:hypothetical protein
MHHIASDGWSVSVLVKEVVELYAAYIENRAAGLAPLPIQYADYAVWQRSNLQGELLDKKVGYWKDKLRGVEPLQLHTDRPRPSVQSRKGAILGYSIDKELGEQLQAFAHQQSSTLFMTLLAAFNVLLHRYTDQEDICVGTPIAGRQHEELEGLIGFFINTLALRSEVRSGSSFKDLLGQIRQSTLEAYGNQEVPFEKVVDAVVKQRDMSRTPLFQVMFVWQNTPEVPELRLGEVQLLPQAFEQNTAKFDLTFTITQTASGLQGSDDVSF